MGSQMHILAIFLVLGVGADDVFVLTDGWKQSVRDVVPVPGETKKERLVRRMTYAYGRTASAVFNTSFTTAMAFVSTAISPIMTISTFGTFAAIAILVNSLWLLHGFLLLSYPWKFMYGPILVLNGVHKTKMYGTKNLQIYLTMKKLKK